jgi:hypothetical protein
MVERVATMTYNTLVYAKINETGQVRMVLAVDKNFEQSGKAYCLQMTDEDISKGLQPTEWYSEKLVTLVEPTMSLDQLLQLKPDTSPKIVCLCGSTRFSQQFQDANINFTVKGYIVLTIGCDMRSDVGLRLDQDTKTRLDILHLHKIDLCTFVHVLNVNGYIGESTRREIEYAKRLNKPVTYLKPLDQAGEFFTK